MSREIEIKLCGFTEEKTLQYAVDQAVDYVGLVFSKNSIRNISFQKAKELSKIIPPDVKKVAVITDISEDFVKKIIENYRPDFLQIHGNHSLEELILVKKNCDEINIIKAFNISDKFNFEENLALMKFCDIILFDSSFSGSGKSFDWNLLSNINIDKKYFLSGGINCDNIIQALEITKAKMVDISSGIEEIRGVKSIKLISKIIQKISNVSKV